MKNEERIKTIKMSGKSCKLSGSKSILDCHCNECYENVIEYLGKKKGEAYKYTGKFALEYIRGKEIIIDHFSTNEQNETASCEAFIRLKGGTDGQVEWIPRNEIVNNLEKI